MSGLSRDILKWIQSLDLSYPVKNPKRDFGNGFLIAEILSRYYKADLNMNSFDNGASKQKRHGNWGVLEKFFKKIEFPIDRATIDNVAHCKEGAVVPLIEQLYTFLTNKPLQATRPVKDEEYIPPFARPHAAALIRGRLRDPDVSLVEDMHHEHKEAERVLREYQDSQRLERTANPDRFTASRSLSPPKMKMRGTTRKVGKADLVGPPVQFQKPEVKQLDEGVSVQQIRAMRTSQLAATGAAVVASGDATGRPLGGSGGGGITSGRVAKPSVDLMNTCVLSRMSGMDELKRFDPRKEAFPSFVDGVRGLPDELAAAVFGDIGAKVAGMVADNCVASPREFFRVFTLCWQCVNSLSRGSRALRAVVDLLSELAATMLDKDASLTPLLFAEFGLQQVCATIKSSPEKVALLSPLLFAFAARDDAEEHVKLITRLRDNLADFSSLLPLLSSLAAAEATADSQLSAALEDLYLFYAVAVLKHSSPTLRGHGLSVLASLCLLQKIHGERHALQLLDRLVAFSEDEWPVQSQLALLVGALLSALPATHTAATRLYDVLRKLAAPSASAVVVHAALVALCRCMRAHPPLQPLFLQLSIDRSDARGLLLADSEEPSSTNIPPVRAVWQPLLVLQMVVGHAKPLENLLPAHVDLLVAITAELEHAPAAELEQWGAALSAVREHLVVELFEPASCEDAATVLLRFLLHPALQRQAQQILVSNIPTETPMLYKIMLDIFSDSRAAGQERSQNNLCNFLRQLGGAADSLAVIVYRMLKSFERSQGAKFPAGLQAVGAFFLERNPALAQMQS